MKLALVLCLLPIIYCLDNGLALTPAMGWNSWNAFSCGINETLIREITDSIISSGLAAAGYQFVNIDDCWAYARNESTNEIIADPKTFPSGIPALADYVHSKGLKFGLYSDAGNLTCMRRPGSLGYEDIDAQTYASWNVDYLKYDNCFNESIAPQLRYPKMRDALNATGRPIYYSICEWRNDPWTWAPPVGNSWRNTNDIQDYWDNIVSILAQQVPIAYLGGPGQWNDPDMLEVGNGNMTTIEYASHFALWAFLKAPLIIGCDTRNMTNDTLRILTSKEIIAINQDKLGRPAEQLYAQHEQQIWGGPVVDGFAAILLNTGDDTSTFNVQFQLFNITGKAYVRDLYAEKTLGVFSDFMSVNVTSHGVFAMKLTPVAEEEGFLSTSIDFDIIC